MTGYTFCSTGHISAAWGNTPQYRTTSSASGAAGYELAAIGTRPNTHAPTYEEWPDPLGQATLQKLAVNCR